MGKPSIRPIKMIKPKRKMLKKTDISRIHATNDWKHHFYSCENDKVPSESRKNRTNVCLCLLMREISTFYYCFSVGLFDKFCIVCIQYAFHLLSAFCVWSFYLFISLALFRCQEMHKVWNRYTIKKGWNNQQQQKKKQTLTSVAEREKANKIELENGVEK